MNHRCIISWQLLFSSLSFRGQQHGALDLRRAETSGTGSEDLPGEHTWALGEDRRDRPGPEQERLYEEVQGEATWTDGLEPTVAHWTVVSEGMFF